MTTGIQYLKHRLFIKYFRDLSTCITEFKFSLFDKNRFLNFAVDLLSNTIHKLFFPGYPYILLVCTVPGTSILGCSDTHYGSTVQ